MRPRDTSEEAWAVQVELLRRAGGARRFQLAADLCAATREITRSGIAARHPEYTDDEVRMALARVVLGADLAAELYPGVELPEP